MFAGVQKVEKLQNINVNNNFVINKFARNEELGRNFYLPAKPILQAANTDDVVFAPQKAHPHRKRNLAISIGSSALVTGAGVLLIMRGLPKSTGKNLEKLKAFFEKKLEKSKISGIDSFNSFYIYSIRKINSFIDKTQSINNVTSLKDILFKKLMDRSRFTSRIHQSISDFFEKISRRTIIKSYGKTSTKFDKMYKSFDKLDKYILSSNPSEVITYNGEKYPKNELIEISKKKRELIKNSMNEFISQYEMNKRYDYIKKSTSKLYDNFWDESFKDFWTKNNKFKRREMWETFIPNEMISSDKKILAEDVAALRNRISYTSIDKQHIMLEHVKTLEDLITPTDKDGFKIIKKLEWFLKNPDGLSNNKEVFLKELQALSERPLEEGLSETVKTNQQTLKQTHIKALTELVKKENGGDLQEMLSIYEAIAPYELSMVKPTVSKAVSAFDKSLNLETVEFFDKVRDLQLGSAPTDVLSILASGGVIAYGLGKAENKDERVSVLLSSGIPIVGAIGTSLLCTARLISGGKSLLFGVVSGVILNRVGKVVDKLYQKNKNVTNI